ncbi:hypothetical protein [Synechococcus sp. PCC 7336]|uniref:hypothetical protein n=1 Tax=Synechococcus sp. PCC 7336 TaxID=195250 RepID=UPI000346386D|nr:hypothetical protein [Synechococcus sp. PCC 7336]
MHSLARQISDLVQTAPQQGIPVSAMEAIAQMLSDIAADLEHLEYFILRDRQSGWWQCLLPVAADSTETIEEAWVVAFGYRSDAEDMLEVLSELGGLSDAPPFQIEAIDVLQLLFLGLGLKQSAGLMACDRSGNALDLLAGQPAKGKTIRCGELRSQLQQCLRRSQRDRSQLA